MVECRFSAMVWQNSCFPAYVGPSFMGQGRASDGGGPLTGPGGCILTSIHEGAVWCCPWKITNLAVQFWLLFLLLLTQGSCPKYNKSPQKTLIQGVASKKWLVYVLSSQSDYLVFSVLKKAKKRYYFVIESSYPRAGVQNLSFQISVSCDVIKDPEFLLFPTQTILCFLLKVCA